MVGLANLMKGPGVTKSVLIPGTNIEASKSQRRMMDIVEAAICLYATLGYDKTTFLEIAKKCGTTRSLVQHYFKTREEIFLFAIQRIRGVLQATIQEAVEPVTDDPEKCLRRYVLANFSWVFNNPHHVKTWALFYYHCSIDEKCRELNSTVVAIGHERIKRMLSIGFKLGVFSNPDAEKAATIIQTLITGRITAIGTENIKKSEAKSIAESTADQCLKVAQGVAL